MGPIRGRYLHWAVTGKPRTPTARLRLTPNDAAASCQAFLLLGYDQGVMSGLVGADNEFGKQFGHPDATMQGIRT